MKKQGFWAKWVSGMLAFALVLALIVTGCKAPQGEKVLPTEVLPPEVKLIEVSKISQTEYTPDSFFGTKGAVYAATEAQTLAVAEAVTTAIGPVIDSAAVGQVPPEAIFGAAIEAALAKGAEVGLDWALREGLGGATAAAAVEAIAGGAAAAKGAAAGASIGVAKGMADVTSVIATSMSAAAARSVTIELRFELKNPNDFQIEVAYQWYNISVAGTPTGRVGYVERMYIPANTTVVVKHARCICLADHIIIPMLTAGVPIHGATLQPPEPGTGAVEKGMAVWSMIRASDTGEQKAERTKDVALWNKERGAVMPLTRDQISEYIGAVYLGGNYISGTTFEEAYDTAATVTWDVQSELGIQSEYGSVTKVYDLSSTAPVH